MPKEKVSGENRWGHNHAPVASRAGRAAARKSGVEIQFRFEDRQVTLSERHSKFAEFPEVHRFLFALGFANTFSQTKAQQFQYIGNLLNRGITEGERLEEADISRIADDAIGAGYARRGRKRLELNPEAGEVFFDPQYKATHA